MKKQLRRSILLVVLGFLTLAAGRQIAMMVELKPLAGDERGTLAEIVVRVAPEDRFALGDDVMLWVELSRDGQQVVRRGWALKVEDRDEPLRVELLVPPGRHTLRVDLEGSSARSKGVWWGDVDLSSASRSSDPDSNDPAAAAAAGTETAAAAGTETAAATETASVAASATVSETASETLPVPAPVPVTDDRATATALESLAGSASESATETATAAATVAVSATDPVPHPDPVPASVPESDAVPVAVPGPAPAPAPAAAPDPPTLVIAVDLHNETAADAAWIGRMAVAVAQRVVETPEAVLVQDVGSATALRLTSWSEVGEAVVARKGGSEGDLSMLVVAALASIDREDERRCVLVLTDGLGPRSKKSWAAARQSARESGAAVLIAGIWSGGFPSGMRKELRKLAEISGGSVFFLQGPEQAEVLVERFVEIVAE